MNLKSGIHYIIKLFWVFVLASIIGYCLETVVALIDKGHFESRQGLVYGPFIQVYGVGAVAYYLILPKIKNKPLLFIISMVIGGVVEFFFSYFQEMIFGTVSWDYPNHFLNIQGRTAFMYWICWGILGIIFITYFYPFINKIEDWIHKNTIKVITVGIFIFMMFNISISWMAGYRQKERMLNVSSKNEFDTFLDEQYPDYRLNRIYANKIQKIETK